MSSATRIPPPAGAPVLFINRIHDTFLLLGALFLLFLSGNQQSYAPKQGIHTIVHVSPADVSIWPVALFLLLPLLEQTRAGRRVPDFLRPERQPASPC